MRPFPRVLILPCSIHLWTTIRAKRSGRTFCSSRDRTDPTRRKPPSLLRPRASERYVAWRDLIATDSFLGAEKGGNRGDDDWLRLRVVGHLQLKRPPDSLVRKNRTCHCQFGKVIDDSRPSLAHDSGMAFINLLL